MNFGRISLLAAAAFAGASAFADAQTTAGIGTTIVFPVTAQTSSFASEVTIFNPGPSALTAHVTFFEANNSAAPGTKVCSDVNVPANRSVQFSIGTQCPLAAGSHFGLLVIADGVSPQTHYFYGYTRVQNPQGIGFSIEGFPIENFNNQVSHATGLKRQAASPTYQTNCFVGSLEQPVSYEIKLFNDGTGAQIGNTLTGSLNAFEQFRYLDVFGPNGVSAPAGDQLNVRAQFRQTSGGTANLIGFCTVQDNTSFGADFRIAKSYGSPSNSFFAQGGNLFGTNAKLGTLDYQSLELYVDNQRAVRIEPTGVAPNIFAGYVGNSAYPGIVGVTISGGGGPGGQSTILRGTYCTLGYGCLNGVLDDFGTIAGGAGNLAGGLGTAGGNGNFASVGGGIGNWAYAGWSTVGGGNGNTASGLLSTVAGGATNTADGDYAFVAGGLENTASGEASFAGGALAHALRRGQFVWADYWGTFFNPETYNASGLWWANATNTFNVRATGGVMMVTGLNGFGTPVTGAAIGPGSGTWASHSDRNVKENFASIDPLSILDKVARLPIESWNYITEGAQVRHLGPVAQDFRAAFGLGANDKTITTVDADGVALAAIQGLHQMLQEKDARIAALEKAVTELKRIVEGRQ